jgi:hypothetical protein
VSSLLPLLMTLITQTAAGGVAAAAPEVSPAPAGRAAATADTAGAPLSVIWADAPAMPVAVAGHAVVDTAEGPVIVGGTAWESDQKRWLKEAWLFDVRAKAWQRHGQLPAGVANALAAPLDAGRLLVVGGADEGGARATVIDWPLDGAPQAAAAAAGFPPLPEPRVYAGGGIVESVLVLAGGAAEANSLDDMTAETLRLDLRRAQRRWEAAAPSPAGPIALSAAAGAGDSLYVFGGMTRQADGAFADIAVAARYEPRRNRWVRISPLPSPRRGATAVAVDDGHILILGGCRTTNAQHAMLDEALVYSVADDRYHAVDRLPYAAMTLGAVLHRGQLFVCGGEDEPRHRANRLIVGHLQPHR